MVIFIDYTRAVVTTAKSKNQNSPSYVGVLFYTTIPAKETMILTASDCYISIKNKTTTLIRTNTTTILL